ncbi:cathepsin G-like [Emydura macquarii macquarii]|uniref:cathepsin G-like n=1 Tax=Emydura macquarii macquarii TaxID=1129001 RepID=UPI00352AD501
MALTMQLLILILLPTAFLLPPAARTGEIIGGWEAQPHSRPYMAYLDIQRGTKYVFCGGFLVTQNFVVTAAHCNGDKINVTLGAHNVRKPGGSEEVISAGRRIRHPQYNNTTFNNDIMLLQLSKNVTLTNVVSTINLPPAPHRVPPGTTCSVAGWGRTSLNHTTDTLREVNLTVMSNETCNRRYPNYDPSSMLCAGDPGDKKTFYRGDSGGPLVCGGVAEGIVSHCIANSIAPPGVYTRISHFMPWINDTMRRI